MDSLHALDLLTEDCWREVFKRVWSPADLKSCSETCSTFEELLERKKTTWMFDAILPHILQYLRVTIVPGEDGRLRQLGDWVALFTSRNVCKGWCQSIEQHLESHNNYFQGVGEQPMFYKYWLRLGEDFGNPTQLFRDNDNTVNPFLGRFLRISHPGLLEEPEQVEPHRNWRDRYIADLLEILRRFGNELWSLSINGWYEHLTFCKNIPVLLEMLPNLVSLQLGPGGPYAVTPVARYEEVYEEEGMDQLEIFLQAHPLPDHPNLKNLVVSALSIRMARPLLDKYAPQLTRMQIYNPVPFLEKVQLFQSLRELEIWSFEATDSLPALRQLRTQLEILQVNVKFADLRKSWPIDELIRNVQHLPLTDLRITAWSYLERELEAFPDSLQNCGVRRVRIRSFTARCLSDNFLRCLPNLEEIYFDYSYRPDPRPGHPNNILQATNTEEEMYESEIWDVLPRLQTIRVKATYGVEPKEYRRSTFEILRFEQTKNILAE